MSIRSAISVLVVVLTSAVLWLLLLGVLGFVAIVFGIYQIAGSGWAFVAGGIALLAVAAFIRQGVAHA